MSVFIVAEIGVNAAGYLDIGKRLTDAAKEAGANAVKTQYWHSATFPHLDDVKWTQSQLAALKEHAEAQGLSWFCTAFDLIGVKLLASLGMKIWKIPSNDHVWADPKLMVAISEQKAETFLVSISPTRFLPYWLFETFPAEKTFGLHCVSRYPTPPDDAQLRKIGWRTGVWEKGISDHSGLPEIPIAAVALGARVVECHITMDKNAEGPDHKASLNPDEFRYMVKAIRNVEEAVA